MITHNTIYMHFIFHFLYSLAQSSACVHCGAGGRLVEFDVSILCYHEYLIQLTIPRRFHPNEG